MRAICINSPESPVALPAQDAVPMPSPSLAHRRGEPYPQPCLLCIHALLSTTRGPLSCRMSQRHRDTAAATVNTLYGTFASPFPCLPFRPFTRQLSCPATWPAWATLPDHFALSYANTFAIIAQYSGRERKSSELRRNTWNALCAPLRCCPFALLLPFCTHKAPISLIMLIMGSTHRHRQAHTHSHTHSFSIETQHSPGHVHAIPLAVTTHFFGNITLSLFAKLDQLWSR